MLSFNSSLSKDSDGFALFVSDKLQFHDKWGVLSKDEIRKINSQITNPSKIGETKKTIARLKTLLRGKLNA